MFVLREGECQPKRNTKESRTTEFYSLLTMEKCIYGLVYPYTSIELHILGPFVSLCKLSGCSISSFKCVHRAFAHSFLVLAIGACRFLYAYFAWCFVVMVSVWMDNRHFKNRHLIHVFVFGKRKFRNWTATALCSVKNLLKWRDP